MKKALFVISVIAIIICLTGIPYLIEGIVARGLAGVNYGRILFLFCFVAFAFGNSRRKNKLQSGKGV